eukprot:13676574-Alexandrium_andersonii.AAC.1
MQLPPARFSAVHCYPRPEQEDPMERCNGTKQWNDQTARFRKMERYTDTVPSYPSSPNKDWACA